MVYEVGMIEPDVREENQARDAVIQSDIARALRNLERLDHPEAEHSSHFKCFMRLIHLECSIE